MKKYPPWVIFPPRKKSKKNERESKDNKKPASTEEKRNKKDEEMKENNKVYSCDDCYKQFTSQKKMRKHYQYCQGYLMDMPGSMNTNMQCGRKKERSKGEGKRFR